MSQTSIANYIGVAIIGVMVVLLANPGYIFFAK